MCVKSYANILDGKLVTQCNLVLKVMTHLMKRKLSPSVGEHLGPVSNLFALEIPLLVENLLMASAWLGSEQIFLVSPWHCTALTPFCKMFLLVATVLLAKI